MMLSAFYYANSKQYGKHFPEVAKHVNCYLDWEPGTKVPPGKKLYVCLNVGWQGSTPEESVAAAAKDLKPIWGRVAAVELADEPDQSASELNLLILRVRKAMTAHGLAPRPIGATFTTTAVMKGQAWKAAQLDWIGVESYIDYRSSESPAQAAKRARSSLKAQLARVAPRRVVIVAQAYDRNGTWQNITSLVAIQQPTFEEAKALGSRCLMLTMFAYARPGGARDHEPLKNELFRLLKGV